MKFTVCKKYGVTNFAVKLKIITPSFQNKFPKSQNVYVKIDKYDILSKQLRTKKVTYFVTYEVHAYKQTYLKYF